MDDSVKRIGRLTLSEAVKSGRLDAFIDQEELRGVPDCDAYVFTAAVERLAKAPQSEDQASRSPCDDGSTEK